MSRETLKLEHRDQIAILTLARPGKRNAIDLQLVGELREALRELSGKDGLAALVLTGEGPAFASGADIFQLKERGREDALAGINSSLFAEVEAFPVPVVAAIEGYALGGGLELALACDLRVAAHGSKLGQPEVSLGIVPGAGAMYRLPRVVGLAKAKELVYTARILEAEAAFEIGLVDHLVPQGEALAKAVELATEISRQDGLAVRLSKQVFRALHPASPGLEALAQAICFESEEKHRRMQAFLDRKVKKDKGATD